MDEKRIREITDAYAGKKVAVIGDFFLDRYAMATYSGVSRETGNKIVRINRHYFVPGGTSNVAANLANYGGSVRCFGVIGDDHYAMVLRDILTSFGVDTANLIASGERVTGSYEKIKIYEDGKYLDEFRVDVDNSNPIPSKIQARLMDEIRAAAGEADLVVVPDYNEEGYPTITPELLDMLVELAAGSGKPFVATSRTRIERFENFVCIPNEYEAATAVWGPQPDIFKAYSPREVEAAGRALIAKTGAAAFVTRGPAGMTAIDAAGRAVEVPTVTLTENIDITGCGDSALCAISMALSVGADAKEAAQLGNMGANVTIRKLHINGTSSPAELIDIYRKVFRSSGLWKE